MNRNREVSWEKKSKSNTKEMDKLLAAQGLEKLSEKEFTAPTDSEDEEDGLPAGLAAALGSKSEKGSKEKQKKPTKKNKREEMSVVQESEPHSSLLSRVMNFKTELTKDLASVESHIHEKNLPAALGKEAVKVQKEGQTVVTLLAKLHQKKAKKKEVEPAVQTALKTLKALKTKKLQMAKALKE